MSIEQQLVSVEKLTIVTHLVEDQDAALEWYLDHLGFEVRADAPFDMDGTTSRWLTVSPPGHEELEIALVELNTDLYEGDMIERLEAMHGTDVMWTFTTSDMDAAVADLKERGVDVDDEIRDTPYGRFAVFRDLDGNSLQLHQSVEMGALSRRESKEPFGAAIGLVGSRTSAQQSCPLFIDPSRSDTARQGEIWGSAQSVR